MRYMQNAVQASDDAPVLLDSFLSAAVEVDIDAVSDGEQVVSVAWIAEQEDEEDGNGETTD